MMSSSLLPSDNQVYRFPVSVKGVIYHNGKVVLLKNGRDEWELPGGKLEIGLGATIGPLLDTWVYHIFEGRDVLILTYGCSPTPFSEVTHSPEHKAVGLFRPEEVPALRMPDGYKQSIQTWVDTLKDL